LGPTASAAHAGRSGLPAPTLQAPLAPFLTVRLFDRPAAPWASGHRGIDLPAAEGDQIASPGDGVVTFAGTVVDRGVVTVDHGGGLLSSIEPIAPTVVVGEKVDAGDRLGVVSGEPGHCAPRTCVHWGVRLQGEYVNPLDVLAGYGRIVLLP
jgi:murein DD-endopeptidase MepM/ murein hydrolase activator NlpD